MSTHGGSTHSSSAAPAGSGGTVLNVYKKVAVVRKPTDTLAYEDAQGQIKTVAAQELGDAISHATPVSQPNKVAKQDIPVPRINHVESYLVRVPANYKTQNAYVRYHKLTEQDYKNQLEYVADEEDETWLQAEKQQVKFGGKLTVDLFERMMDILETETAFDVIITIGQADHLFRTKIPELYTIFAGKARQGHATAKHVLNDVYAVSLLCVCLCVFEHSSVINCLVKQVTHRKISGCFLPFVQCKRRLPLLVFFESISFPYNFSHTLFFLYPIHEKQTGYRKDRN
jgi:hypothetical protein